VSPEVRTHTGPFTVQLVLAGFIVLGAIVGSALGGLRSIGAAVFFLGIILFFGGKGAMYWFFRQRAKQGTVLPAFLADSEWHLVSLAYFGSAVCFLVAVLLGHERFWSTVGVIGALILGWTFFVVSRKHGIA
jgi:hypothetical protein